jgi:molybdate transport system substrate-binding protein
MRKSHFSRFFMLAALFLVMQGSFVFARGAQAPDTVELIVGAAMSLKDVTTDLATAYKAANPSVTLTFTYASSGALQNQIMEGAPIDVFMSAAVLQMRNLEERGLIYGQSRNLVTNKVVLIVPSESTASIRGFRDVTDNSIAKLGVGDPASMPLGAYARDIFTALGIADAVFQKAVLGNDVRQVLTWVEMGEVDAGVVFMTDAMTTNRVRVVEIADSSLHTPSINPVGIIASSSHTKEAQKFVDYLFSNEARAIFERHGFSMYQ